MSVAKPISSPPVDQTIENKVGAGAISSEVDHTDILSDDIEVLLSHPEFSDVILVVNGEKIPANKALLAVRKVTFRGLLYGGLKESGDGEVVLNQINVFAFRIVLRYLYTAKLTLSDYEEDQLLEILSVAHQYCVNDLQHAIADYLKGFLQLPTNEVSQLLSSLDTFSIDELSKFRAIRAWIMAHKELQIDTEEMIMGCVRLPHITRDALVKEVRESGLLKAETILNAMEKRIRMFKEEEEKKKKNTLSTVM
ncbi:unnamed protein product [Haemonchus placei]|uniref:BTB domain-containing protein n=1 Tax=Haemonchus placei TaxID=6290 RepID=A0A0N4WD87_HAEPC|nr:unnamed protein product [Haemonchus placei]